MSTKHASALHVGGFPSRFFPVFSGEAALSSLVTGNVLLLLSLNVLNSSLFGFKVTALQINTYEYELLDISSLKKKKLKQALFRWKGIE